MLAVTQHLREGRKPFQSRRFRCGDVTAANALYDAVIGTMKDSGVPAAAISGGPGTGKYNPTWLRKS